MGAEGGLGPHTVMVSVMLHYNVVIWGVWGIKNRIQASHMQSMLHNPLELSLSSGTGIYKWQLIAFNALFLILDENNGGMEGKFFLPLLCLRYVGEMERKYRNYELMFLYIMLVNLKSIYLLHCFIGLFCTWGMYPVLFRDSCSVHKDCSWQDSGALAALEIQPRPLRLES